MSAQEICERYKCGHHIHIGHPDDHLKEPEEREKDAHVMRQAIDLIIKHEMERGGISKDANGLLVFNDPSVLTRFPRVRDSSNIRCCCPDDAAEDHVDE